MQKHQSIDSSGAIVVEYKYDAWGELLQTASTLGKLNPFRYRGYVYDEETFLYCLRSRYYDPEWGRFINADSLICNLYRVQNNVWSYALMRQRVMLILMDR